MSEQLTEQRISEIKRFLSGLAGEKYIQPVAKRFLFEAADLIESLQREREERENPQPLTSCFEFRDLIGKPTWVKMRSGRIWCGIMRYDQRKNRYAVTSHINEIYLPAVGDPQPMEKFYATEPKGEHHD